MANRACVLIAAPALVIRQLGAALPPEVEVVGAATWEEATQRLEVADPALIVVCYVFDEMRPYRFIRHARQKYRNTPIFLVRAVTVRLGSGHEADVRRSYTDLGANEFMNFSDLANERGLDTALQEFARVAASLARIA
jgi:PleD family two-component response regulator